MTRQIRVPGLLDVIRTDDAELIRSLADHEALDRDFEARGPLINRLLAGRVRRGLRSAMGPLPSAMMRDDRTRAQVQTELREKFRVGNWDEAGVGNLGAYVSGADTRPVGELTQEVVGRVLDGEYRANEETWDAATKVQRHLSSRNPILRIIRWLSGELMRAQNVLSRASRNDGASVHGTGVAVHNLVDSLNWMREAWAEPGLRTRLTPLTAARAAILAPETVLRAGAYDTDIVGGTLAPGTLVALDTRKAASRSMDAHLAFLGDSWSGCPAEAWVMALLEEVWRQAEEDAV